MYSVQCITCWLYGQLVIHEGDTPLPFWYAVFRFFLDSTQYAKGRYAVLKNPAILYADNNFYFQKVQFTSRNKLNKVKNSNFRVLALLALILDISSSFRGLNMNLGNRNTEKYRANTTKLTLTRMILHVHATDCIFKFFI